MAEPTVGIKAVFDGAAAQVGLKKLRQGVDDATKSARSQSSTIGGLARVQKSVASLIGVYTAAAAGVTALGAAAFSALKEYAASEVSTNRLAASVRAATGSWSAYRAELDATIRAGMNKAFDDEDQADALSRLVQATQSVTGAQDLLKVSQDVSRGTGKDLVSTAVMLGKVYNGNTGAAKKFGIAVREGATAQEVLTEIQKRYAGQADAYANSVQGSIDKMTVAWANAKEAAGGFLARANITFDTASGGTITGYLTSRASILNAWSTNGYKAALAQENLNIKVREGKMTQEEAAAAYEKLYGKTAKLTQSTNDATTAIQELTAAQDDAANAAYALEDADIANERSHYRLADAKKALTEAVKHHGKNSQEAKQAQLDYRDATLAAKRADDALRDAMSESDDPTQRAIANMQRLKTQADALAASANKAANQLDSMFGKGAGKATRDASKYGGRRDRAYGSIERATPGGVPVTVAEAGSDEAIIPLNRSERSLALLAEATRRIGGGSGGNVTNVNVYGSRSDASWIATQVRLALAGSSSLATL